jgi:hypothetical protein
MTGLNRVPRSYNDAVDLLVEWHRDEGIKIYNMPDPNQQTVQLIEVSNSFGDDDPIRPLAMGPSHDFPFPTSVILISEHDWHLIENGAQYLPTGWMLDKLEKVWPQ